LRSYWTRQSGRDLSLAQIALDNGYPEWACYLAQQAAEKAVKSVFFELETHWPHQFTIHNISDLILYVPAKFLEGVNKSEFNKASERFVGEEVHNAPRYPGILPPGYAPPDLFDDNKADEFIRAAGVIIENVSIIIENIANN
jgi:HEPN domain-containing protein